MDEHMARCLELHFDEQAIGELLRTVAKLAIDGTSHDGAHHRRWFAQEIVRIIQATELVTREPGIAP